MFEFLKKANGATPASIAPGVSATRILKLADKGLLLGFIGSIVAVFVLDGIFFMAWAPTWYLVPVFLLIGVVIRLTGAFSGPTLQVATKRPKAATMDDGSKPKRPKLENRRETRSLRALSIACGLLCLVPAMSFFAGGQANLSNAADVAAATNKVSDTNKADRIKHIDDQIKDDEKTRDDSITETNQTIYNIVHDDVPGISKADNESITKLRAEIQGYRETAKTNIAALRTQISNIEKEKEDKQTDTAAKTTKISPVYAIFAVVATVWGKADIWARTVLFMFALLIEAIAFFGLGIYQGLHKYLIAAIQRLELEEIDHQGQMAAEKARTEARAEAVRLKEKAVSDKEIADIELDAAKVRARTEALRAGEDGEIYDARLTAERNLAVARANAEIARLHEQADEAGRVTPANDPMSPTSRAARAAGLGAGQSKQADKAADERVILVDDWSERDMQQLRKTG